MTEPLRAALPARHPRAGERAIALGSLAEDTWVWFARRYDPTTYEYMTRIFEAAGFQPKVTQEVNQALIFLDLVAAGLGVSLVTRSSTAFNVPGIAFVDLEPPQPLAEFNLVWRRDDPSPLVAAFRAIVREIAGAT